MISRTRSPAVEPTVDVLQDGIQAFRLRFYANGRWQERWDNTQSLPLGPRSHPGRWMGYGDITRLFLITPGASQ
ncbi:type II secretion system protein J [Raoultella planticola]|uniref:Type II secretion system protein J n=1 Tax=Raoultella planticola TaxID=575 RepID=A0A485B681_RAOPL|nr:type II secretion system protein J [Raoultella planticola]